MTTTPLTDNFGRSFHYLRLSVEDACNFRCLYCLPGGYHKAEEAAPLSVAEIRRAVAAFAGLGLWKVRLTGGEPTVRKDIAEIARAVASAPGVRRVALSTNGYRLLELAGPLKDAGIAAVNVSVDSLDPERFRGITGQDKLAAVLAGIGECLRLGIETKVNVVLMKDLNADEVGRFLEWTIISPVGVRFIELMPTGENKDFFQRQHLSAESLLQRLAAGGWLEQPRSEGAGPARLFRHPAHRGAVGLIAPYAPSFCSTCNRLRVTSRGALRLCLFAEADLSLRHLMHDDSQIPQLQQAVRDLIGRKEVSHYLPEGRVGNVRHFAMMGG